MALWVCLGCTAAYAVGLPRCPHCRSTEYAEEGEMPKIGPDGTVSYEPGREPPGWQPAQVRQGEPAEASTELREHPGYGQEMHGIEHPADGTMSPPLSNSPEPAVPVAAELAAAEAKPKPAAAKPSAARDKRAALRKQLGGGDD